MLLLLVIPFLLVLPCLFNTHRETKFSRSHVLFDIFLSQLIRAASLRESTHASVLHHIVFACLLTVFFLLRMDGAELTESIWRSFICLSWIIDAELAGLCDFSKNLLPLLCAGKVNICHLGCHWDSTPSRRFILWWHYRFGLRTRSKSSLFQSPIFKMPRELRYFVDHFFVLRVTCTIHAVYVVKLLARYVIEKHTFLWMLRSWLRLFFAEPRRSFVDIFGIHNYLVHVYSSCS